MDNSSSTNEINELRKIYSGKVIIHSDERKLWEAFFLCLIELLHFKNKYDIRLDEILETGKTISYLNNEGNS